MSDGGKGSRPRPFSVSHAEWETRWDAIFGRDLQEEYTENKTQNQKEQEAATGSRLTDSANTNNA